MANVVSAGEIAVHAIERGRLRRAQMCAAILKLIEGERRDPAIAIDGRLERGDAVGRRNRGAEMLQPVFDPLHRPSGRARRGGDEHDVGKDRLLDAEAAARIRRRAQPQAIAGDLQRPGHHRMQAERALEIGEDVVGVLGGVVFGDDAIGLDRRA